MPISNRSAGSPGGKVSLAVQLTAPVGECGFPHSDRPGTPAREVTQRFPLDIGILVRDTALRLVLYGRGTLTNLPPTNEDADL